LIEGEKAQLVLKAITDNLLTPVGLRSLSAQDKNYIGIYEGDPLHRDGAYHQGTVWSWLLGPYVDALMKVDGSKQKAQDIIQHFSYHLDEAGIGSISEIFDGDSPHLPRGCIAQAWGVSEMFRVISEYKL
jgi:glycogen debranching enzyme